MTTVNAAHFPLRAVIVGAGRIAARDRSSHAETISRYPEWFKLSAFIDPDPEALLLATTRWNVQGFADWENLAKARLNPDIFIIASPDRLHAQHAHQAMALKPRAIVIEKPVAQTSSEIQELLALGQKSDLSSTLIFVNYSRRYTSPLRDLRRRLESGEFGRYLHGHGTYSKGLLHSGSHLINALLPVLDRKISSVQVLEKKFDYGPDDPSIDALVRYDDGSYFSLASIDAKFYEVFEAELFFEKARVRIQNLGQEIFYDAPDVSDHDPRIRYLQRNPASEQTRPNEASSGLYENIRNTLGGSARPECDLLDSLATISLCEKIRNS